MGEKITKRIHDFFSGHLTSATSWLMGIDLILLLMFALCTLFPILFKAGLLIVDLILAGTLAIFYACFVSKMREALAAPSVRSNTIFTAVPLSAFG